MRAGTPLTQLIEFSFGHPDGAISWQLLGQQGQLITQGEVVPAADAASAVITVAGSHQSLTAGQLVAARELSWAYTVGGIVYTGERRYRLEAFLPFGLARDGVRRKLGVEVHELEDDSIDLVSAYGKFTELVGADELAFIEAAGGYPAIVICDAIEALAALAVVPSLQVSLAQKESSGTNQFHRAAINWDDIRGQLDDYVAAGQRIVDPGFDSTIGYTPLLVRVIREDPFTS
jgi:hypothetical protein